MVYWSIRNGISPTPSSRKQIAAILKAIPDGIDGNIYELGSGWGTLALALAKRFPGNQVTGIENSPVPYWISKVLQFSCGLHNLRFAYGNFLKFNLSESSLIVCYLYPGGMQKLKEKLKNLKPGTIIVTSTFSIPDWTPLKKLEAQDLYRSPIYVYEIPESA